jgi:opacity protein-like surface antigen
LRNRASLQRYFRQTTFAPATVLPLLRLVPVAQTRSFHSISSSKSDFALSSGARPSQIKKHGLDIVRFNGAVIGADSYNASKSEWLFLANAYVDLGTWWCVTPFVGAGLGLSRNTISSFLDINTPNRGVAYAPAASRWDLAWALHAGLAYRLSTGLTLELAYRYVSLGDGETGAVTNFQGFSRGRTVEFKDITSHDAKIGIRWELDSPPVYDPLALIRKG